MNYSTCEDCGSQLSDAGLVCPMCGVWIRVNDYLPKYELAVCNAFSWESDPVLVYDPKWPHPVIARVYSKDGKSVLYWMTQRHGDVICPTHWQPLPEPPG